MIALSPAARIHLSLLGPVAASALVLPAPALPEPVQPDPNEPAMVEGPNFKLWERRRMRSTVVQVVGMDAGLLALRFLEEPPSEKAWRAEARFEHDGWWYEILASEGPGSAPEEDEAPFGRALLRCLGTSKAGVQ